MSTDLLSTEAATRRYENERLRGEQIVSGEEWSWGWRSCAGLIRAHRRAEFLIKGAGLKPGVKCLELGCGTGEFTKRLLISGCELHAVELSPATAQYCRNAVDNRA